MINKTPIFLSYKFYLKIIRAARAGKAKDTLQPVSLCNECRVYRTFPGKSINTERKSARA